MDTTLICIRKKNLINLGYRDFTNIKTHFTIHTDTIKHKTGKRKTRSDKKYNGNCKHCEYYTSSKTNMKLHIVNTHCTKEEKKQQFKYYCEYCDYGGFAKSLFDNHLKTKKHKLIMEALNRNN